MYDHSALCIFKFNTVTIILLSRTHLNRLIQFAVSGVRVVLCGFQGVKESFSCEDYVYLKIVEHFYNALIFLAV